MSEPKDPAIKLFGRTIPLPESPPPRSFIAFVTAGDDNTGAYNHHHDDSPSSSLLLEVNIDGDGEDLDADKETVGGKSAGSKLEVGDGDGDDDGDGGLSVSTEEFTNSDTSAVRSENSKVLPGEETNPSSTTKTDEQNETSNSQEKTLKKPDKILPCPRCNSMDTKFCYYNNYNVNQPRHFCKNCQRYWTAGGTMRNVPVGAGRRKNKNSAAPHHRQIIVSEALQHARTDVSNGIQHSTLKPNGNVLAFGSDTPLCESMASVLNLADKTRNGFQKPEALKIPVAYENGENENDDQSQESAATPSFINSEEAKTGPQDQVIHNCQGFLPTQIPFFPGAPWPYPWNSPQWSSPIPPPTFYPPGIPMPFYPTAPFWGCTVPGAWTIPWLPQPPSLSPIAQNHAPNSPTLGKHSRDENVSKQSDSGEDERQKDNKGERCIWIPKTLRIDDPGEAAKSSIWATLGIKNDKNDSVSEGLFKAFQSKKGDEKTHKAEPSPVLQVNPAALSRSIKFHESS